MSEEEKKAINLLKQTIDHNSSIYTDDLGDNDIRIILNIIEKQQKEIEDLKEKQDYARLEKEQLLEDVKKYYIKKDKIREKIKEIERKDFKNEINYSEYHYKTEVLIELLEE